MPPGEINDSEKAAWSHAISALDEHRQPRELHLIPEDRTSDPLQYYMQLVRIEESFRVLKSDLNLRPVHHQLDRRIEAHIFISVL